MGDSFQFAYLHWYNSSWQSDEYGLLYNYNTNESLIELREDGGHPYVLAKLSADGWLIVGFEQKVPRADNDWAMRWALQKRIASTSAPANE